MQGIQKDFIYVIEMINRATTPLQLDFCKEATELFFIVHKDEDMYQTLLGTILGKSAIFN